MSQYNAAPPCAADNAGRDATDLELAPFLPTMDQSGEWNSPAHEHSVRSEAALPSQVGLQNDPQDPPNSNAGTCSTSFPTNQHLEQHAAKTKHKAYLCTCGCQKGFTKRSALRRHIQESAQAREHRCPLCEHKCKRVGHVEQHLRLVHKKSKDEIKRLLSTQRPQPGQASEPSRTTPAAVPTIGSMAAQAGNANSIPGGLWTGPIGFSAPAFVDHSGSRPGDSSAFFPALPVLGPGQVTITPAFTPQNFTMQAPAFPAYFAYPAYAVSAVPAPTGFFANPVPDVSGYPAAPLDGTNHFFNVNTASVPVNPADGFAMPNLGTDFMMDFSGYGYNTFGL